MNKKVLTSLVIATLLASTNIVSATERIVVEEGKTLNLQDMMLEDFNFDEEIGGVIENHGSLNIENSSFTGNIGASGGVLWNSETGTLDVRDVTFSNNTATKNDGDGGAIVNGGTINNLNGTFTNNNAYYNGGAITNLGKIKTLDSKFTGNKTLAISDEDLDGNGGALDNEDGGAIEEVKGLFDGNTAVNNGGAIANTSTIKTISADFKNNSAQNGGAIYNVGTLNSIEKSNFDANKAKPLNIVDVKILADGWRYDEEMRALVSLEGEYIYAEYNDTSRTLNFVKDGVVIGTISNNGFGGAIYNENNDLSIVNSTFTNNSILLEAENLFNYPNIAGGAIAHNGGNLYINSSTFKNNSALLKHKETYNEEDFHSEQFQYFGQGGAINSNTGEVSVIASTFENNAATFGGALSSADTLYVSGSRFLNNTAKTQYKYSREENLNGQNYKSYDNSFDGAGGAIEKYDDAEIINSEFIGNQAAIDGGAIMSFGGNLLVKDSSFKNNSAKSYSDYKEYYLDENNEIQVEEFKGYEGAGGAISAIGDYQANKLDILNSLFESNISGIDGGGAIASSVNVDIKESLFTANKTDGSGGAIKMNSLDTTLDILATNFVDNIAKENGGAILSSLNTNIQNAVFNNNQAKNGGAVYSDIEDILNVSETMTLNIKDSAFENNKAEVSGGALAVSGLDTNISDSLFVNNNSNGSGGAITTNTWNLGDNKFSNVKISNTNFVGNTAQGNGGAINASGPTRLVDNDFTSNTAIKGGAIYAGYTGNFADLGSIAEDLNIETGTRITALNKDVKFSRNKADKGADIYLENNKLYLNANEGRTISFDGGIIGKNSIIDINNSSVNDLYENLSSIGRVVMDNFVSPDTDSTLAVNLKAGTLVLGKENYLNGTDLTLEEGSTLDLINNSIGTMNLNNLISNNAQVNLDMDLASTTKNFDSISAKTASGTLNLKDVNITSDLVDGVNNINVKLSDLGVAEGLEIKTPKNGINVLTNDYVYTITAKNGNFSLDRATDANGNAIKTDGFTVAFNQTDKVGGVDVSLSEDRNYSATSDIKITGGNSEKGWTGDLAGKSLTVSGNGYRLDGELNTAMVVGNGKTLNLNDTSVEGFITSDERKGALTVKDGGTLNVAAINHDINLSTSNSENNNVIYLDGTSSKSLFRTENLKSINVESDVRSASQSNELKLTGDGKITFNGIVDPLTLTNENKTTVHNNYLDDVIYNLNSGVVTISKDEYLNGQGNKNTLNFNGGTLNIANNSIGNIDLAALNINSNSNIMLDADLKNEIMDRIIADSVSANTDAILNVSHINLLSDTEKEVVSINAVDPIVTLDSGDTLASHIATTVTNVAYSPIYKYGVGYDSATGDFTFTRGATNQYQNINPAVMVSPVAAQLGGYMSMIDTYNNAFNNMDMRMLNSSSVRIAQKQANRYAITDSKISGYVSNESNSGGMWVRPFTSYDSVGLKHGPKVKGYSYGTFIGGDTAVHQFKNSAEGVLSTHISYLGSHQRFDGNSIYNNGGNLGVTGTLYKGNFFSGLTVNAGASIADASTMYGSEDFPMFMAGIANKTGYNFEFKNGKFILQPSLLMSYTLVTADNYSNAAGVKINADPLHAFQISPNIRLIMNTEGGWQPYLTAGMNWNIMNDAEFRANAATLPYLSVKPYVQYGLGIQRTINDNFTAYAQVLLRHGGRNGIAGNAGLKYIFGGKNKTDKQEL